MKHCAHFIVIIFCSFCAYSQTSHGTIIIAAIGKDGILLESDSRQNISLAKGKSSFVLAYLDNVNKIFIANKYAVAMTGRSYSKDLSVQVLIDEFLKTKPSYTTPGSFLSQFVDFIKTKNKFFLNVFDRSAEIFCCGYYDSKPWIATYHNDTAMAMHDSGYVISERKMESEGVKKKLKEAETCKEMSAIADDIITICPLLNRAAKYTIGGDPIALQLLPNGSFKWISDNKLVYWKTQKEYIRDYFSGKVKLNYVKPEYKSTVDSLYRLYMNDKISL